MSGYLGHGVRQVRRAVLLLLAGLLLSASSRGADEWPALPDVDGAVLIPAQEWPLRPGPRTVKILIHYPGGKRTGVTEQTGVMLTLHNWGGTDCVGTADPRTLAKELNVVAICVNYLQSGAKDSIEGPEPYDHGYLQALDSLRALWFVTQGLKDARQPFAQGRIYSTGGSGGGNVTLMCNKLAPRTFACVVDLCGMPKLSDDIAFNLPGGVDLDARYRRDPSDPYYLSPDAQEIRNLGHQAHLQSMRELGSSAKILVVHGAEDSTYADAKEMVDNMAEAKLAIEPHFITKTDVDGKVFTTSGHALGNRTLIVLQTAGRYLRPDSPDLLVHEGPSDFDLCDEKVRYATPGGEWIISYREGFPVGRFEQEK